MTVQELIELLEDEVQSYEVRVTLGYSEYPIAGISGDLESRMIFIDVTE